MLMTPQWRTGILSQPTPRALPPNPFQVDTVRGTVNGNGTLDLPLNSLAAAIGACAGLEGYVIQVVAPEAVPLRQEVIYESSLALTVEGLNGQNWFIYGSDVLTNVWSGTGPVYSRVLNYTILTQVVVTSLTEVIDGGVFKRKLLINTLTPTNPGPGEFGYATGVLYVRLWDNSPASSHTFEVPRRNTCVNTCGFGGLTLHNVVARHALVNCLHNGKSGQPLGTGKMYLFDSLAEYGVNGGVGAAGQNEETICTRVIANRSSNDAFNVHVNSGRGYMELRACVGSFSGDKAGQSAQGASCHDYSHLVIKGGEFSSSVSGGMVAIDSSRCDIYGDTEWGAVLINRNMRLGNTPGPVSTQASCAWMDSSSGVVTGDVTVSNGLGTGVLATTFVSGAHSIHSIGNALPDVIPA